MYILHLIHLALQNLNHERRYSKLFSFFFFTIEAQRKIRAVQIWWNCFFGETFCSDLPPAEFNLHMNFVQVKQHLKVISHALSFKRDISWLWQWSFSKCNTSISPVFLRQKYWKKYIWQGQRNSSIDKAALGIKMNTDRNSIIRLKAGVQLSQRQTSMKWYFIRNTFPIVEKYVSFLVCCVFMKGKRGVVNELLIFGEQSWIFGVTA